MSPSKTKSCRCVAAGRCKPPALCRSQQMTDALAQCGNLDWLLQVVGSAVADGLDGGLGRVVGGHEDDVGRGCERHDLAEDFEPAQSWHHQVSDDELRTERPDEFETLPRIRLRVESQISLLQRGMQQFQAAQIVVYDDRAN